MSETKLPASPSLEFLKKLAKDRLRELRHDDSEATLAAAQRAVARDHGFSSWRALKAEVEQRRAGHVARFFEACVQGNVDALRQMLEDDPTLVRSTDPKRPLRGWTGLHVAAERGRSDGVRLLLERGADPNAREEGDNTYPLHWAAAKGDWEIVRALLDAGGDVHGIGDLHELDAIGWAAYFGEPGEGRSRVIALLLERGALHHAFSAIALGDLDAIRSLVARDPKAFDRRMSRFEDGRTALHLAIARKRRDILDLLIRLGADLEAPDGRGKTALEAAMLLGDPQSLSRLRAAGARMPAPVERPKVGMAELAASVKKSVAMISAPDIAAALDWYVSIGFRELGRYADGGVVNFGMVAVGGAEVMFRPGKGPGEDGVSLWFYTDRVDDIYQVLRTRQLDAVEAGAEGVVFVEDINDTFYGAREFGVRDLNGYALYFIQTREG